MTKPLVSRLRLFVGLGTLLSSFALVSLAPTSLHAQADTELKVSTSSREEVRQFFRTVYAASENVPIGWTGSYSTSNPVAAAGTTSAAFQQSVLLRINFFRAFVGVPATVTLNPTFSAKDQLAALMMSANNDLLHNGIPTNWAFYTADGSEAASQSNLSLGLNGAAAITSLIQDSDGSGTLVNLGANALAGHRRWIIYPQTKQTGVGDVPGNGTLNPAHASWVTANFGQPRPATREEFVAYPPPGYAPYQLVFPRWSFSYAGADFTSATVTMTRAGVSIPTRLEPINNSGGGENTLVWVYNGLTTTETTGHPRPSADLTYSVTVSGVKVGNVTKAPFIYNVTVFDPDVAGPDSAPVAITAATIPTVGVAGTFNVAKPAFATGFEWRTVTLANYAKTYTAEAGLDGLVATITPGTPSVVQSTTVDTGGSAYRLTHINPRSDQILTLPDTFFIRGDSTLNFSSRLGIVTNIQTARVQVSPDDGASWNDIYTQVGATPVSGSPTPTESSFVKRSLPLTAYAGRTIRVRFLFGIEVSGSAFTADATNTVGWFLDNIAMVNVQTATATAPISVASGSTFTMTPAALGPFIVQARAVLFRAYPLEWGPLAQLTAATPSDPTNPARLINLSVLTDVAAAGDKFTLGYVVGGNGTSGPKPLVIRAAGPSLGAFGVPGTLDDPKLETFTDSTKTGDNNDWGGSATISDAMASVGAFPFAAPNSKDAAVLAQISTRANSVVVSANNGTSTGTVLAEVYDATAANAYSSATPRLINVSVNKHIGNGLTMGFVVGGTGARNILIRAIGPTLGDFGVGGVVTNPRLELFQTSPKASIGSNDDWGGAPALVEAFRQVGAFPLPLTSKDAAILIPLTPGNYSVVVNGVGNTTGVALVEVYEVP